MNWLIGLLAAAAFWGSFYVWPYVEEVIDILFLMQILMTIMVFLWFSGVSWLVIDSRKRKVNK